MGWEAQSRILLPDKGLSVVLQGGQDFISPSICFPVSPWFWPRGALLFGPKQLRIILLCPRMGNAPGVSLPVQVFPREKEDELRHIFDSEPFDCHLLELPGHSISCWCVWLCPCITIISLSLPRYAGGWEEVRFLPRQEQAVQVCDGQAGGDPRLGGRSCSGARTSSASHSPCQAVLRRELQRGQESVCMQLVPYFIIFFFILFPCSTPSALGGVGVNITFCIATCQLAGMEPGQAPATPTARR